MAIPAGSTRVSLLGVVGTYEVWDTSFWMTGLAIASNGDAADAAQTVATAWAASDHDAINAHWAPADGLQNIKVYHYTGGSSAAFIGEATPDEGAGTATGNLMPLQLSFCTTLQTASSGRSFRGRMYWPYTAGVINLVSHQESQANVTAYAEAVSSFLGTTKLSFSNSQVVVMSATRSVTTPVIQVRADSRLDIQRRRANRQLPIFTATSPIDV